MTTVPLLQIAPSGTSARRREVGDRLELLTALIEGPSFDPLFRPDAIKVPPDHRDYGWRCEVPQCQRACNPARDYCQAHQAQWSAWQKDGRNRQEFHAVAGAMPTRGLMDPPPCRICPDMPARGARGMCVIHDRRWICRVGWDKVKEREPDLESWIKLQKPLPGFGICVVAACPDVAERPLGLCYRHDQRYRLDGRPGGASLPGNWRTRAVNGDVFQVTYDDVDVFRRWCAEAVPICRMDGKLSLLGLRPLVKAEIKWCLFQHTQRPGERRWALPWIQYLADHCRKHDATSLFDLDQSLLGVEGYQQTKPVAVRMMDLLRPIYFTSADTKEAGFVELGHYGVKLPYTGGRFELSAVSQRWLRDLLWEYIDGKLISADPPRGRFLLDGGRRGCVELSAFLEVAVDGGGHDPQMLTVEHMRAFVADQRHRAEHGLQALGLHRYSEAKSRRFDAPATAGTIASVFNGARRVLRAGFETGAVEGLGLSREFINALPPGPTRTRGRRRPFPDEVAQALGAEANLRLLHALDPDDRGLQDIWEALIFTGRRCGEVIEARLDCIDRYHGLPMFWHDQTKTNRLDQAIRIPERLFARIRARQEKTIARFTTHHSRPPTSQEMEHLALFPRRTTNREGLKEVSYGWFSTKLAEWIDQLDIGHWVPHQARHRLATDLIKNGADLSYVKRYMGHVSDSMGEHYIHLASIDPRIEEALNAVWVSGPGSALPGELLSAGAEPMTRQQAEALAIDLMRRSTPADGGFCTFQPVVDGGACPFNLDCHNCDKFVMSGADLIYWHRKREQWQTLAERAPDAATADWLHEVFEPTARAITGLEKALAGLGLLDEALTLDLRRPQDYFARVWSTAFRPGDLVAHDDVPALAGEVTGGL